MVQKLQIRYLSCLDLVNGYVYELTTVLTQYSDKGVLCFVEEVYLLWNCGVCVCVNVKIHGWVAMEIQFWIVYLTEQNHKSPQVFCVRYQLTGQSTELFRWKGWVVCKYIQVYLQIILKQNSGKFKICRYKEVMPSCDLFVRAEIYYSYLAFSKYFLL